MIYIVRLTVFLGVIFLFNSCGGNNGGNNQNVISSYEKNIILTNSSDTNVTIKGKGEDKLVLNIPLLSPNRMDTNVTIKLLYNNHLPEIAINKDINFTTPVELIFRSSNLIDGNTTLVYKASDTTYFVPCIVENHILKAKLWHFSDYGFDTVPAKSDRLREDINSRLTALNTSAQSKRLGEISNDLLGDLYVKMLAYEGSDEFDSMYHSFIDAILDASNNTLEYYKNRDIHYFSGLCPTDEMMNALNELYSVYLYNKDFYDGFRENLSEEDRILTSGMYEDAILVEEKIITNSKVKWEALIRPKCDNKLWNYVKCTQKYIDNVEFAEIVFLNSELYTKNLAEEIQQAFQNNIKSDAQEALNSGDCKCMLLYKNIINVYFKDTLSSLLQALEDATKSCNNTECPLLWDVAYQAIDVYNGSPDITWSGGYEFNNVYIEQVDDAWVKLSEAQRVACEPYREKYKGERVKATSYYGDFTSDDQITMEEPYIREDDNGNEYIEVDGKNIYQQLNEFQTFSIEDNRYGTERYTFTPHVYGFAYSDQ